MPRVFQNPDGSIRIMRLNERYRLPNETDAQFFTRETAKQPVLGSLPFADVPEASIPVDRSSRHAWQLQNGQVIVNPTVPDTDDIKKRKARNSLKGGNPNKSITVQDLIDMGLL